MHSYQRHCHAFSTGIDPHLQGNHRVRWVIVCAGEPNVNHECQIPTHCVPMFVFCRLFDFGAGGLTALLCPSVRPVPASCVLGLVLPVLPDWLPGALGSGQSGRVMLRMMLLRIPDFLIPKGLQAGSLYVKQGIVASPDALKNTRRLTILKRCFGHVQPFIDAVVGLVERVKDEADVL